MERKPKKAPKHIDIFCPFCMKQYRPNNVVFRRRSGKGILDPYLCQFYKDYRDTEWNEMTLPVVDPAYLEADALIFDELGILKKVKIAEEALPLTQRVCPYCHNTHHTKAGTTPLHVVTIIGKRKVGKSTYEAALVDSLRNDGFGVLNFSTTPHNTTLNTIEDNIQVLGKGELDKWYKTVRMNGPFSYLLNYPKEEYPPCMLTTLDLPGEYFDSSEQSNMLETCGEAIRYSQTCILLIDIEEVESNLSVIDSMMRVYEKELKSGKVNVAAVLYKADKLMKYFPDQPRFLSYHSVRDYQNGAKIDLNQLRENSFQIEEFIIKKHKKLRSINESLRAGIADGHFMWFTAYSLLDGVYKTNNIEEPLLWSMALNGQYSALGGAV